MPISLDEFLSSPRKPNPNKRDDLRDLRPPTFPSGHIICKTCRGDGKISFLDNVKCPRCDGLGHRPAPLRETAIGIVTWWSRYTCACGCTYDAPTFTNCVTIHYRVEKPICRNGHISHYKFVEERYTPTYDNPLPDAPHSIQFHDTNISRCRICAPRTQEAIVDEHANT